MATLYDTIGKGYRKHRVPDARIGAHLLSALGDSASVANIGAGAGGYEPEDRFVVALEPSMTMIRQRPGSAAPAIQAVASDLPLRDHSVAAALAFLTIHHWKDHARGLAELGRVARDRVVIVTWDPASAGFWLTTNYFPEILAIDRQIFPSIDALVRGFASASVHALPIPHDCTDGFLGAYWRRPWAYLDPGVRQGMSTFSKIEGVDEGLARLREDLASGLWEAQYGDLLRQDAIDLGYRTIVADLYPSQVA